MKKFSKVGKRVMALFIVALLNINTFATTATNDGTAFVTKAEFDKMTDKFNEQMDAYQAGLNTKIDTAIANYLAGMSSQASITLDNYVKQAKEVDEKNTKFTAWKTPQAHKTNFDLNAGFASYFSAGCMQGSNNTLTGLYGYDGISNAAVWNGGYSSIRYTNYTGDTAAYTSAYYYANFPWIDNNNTTDFTLQSIERKRLHVDLYANQNAFSANQKTTNWSGRTWRWTAASITVDFSALTQPSSFTHPSLGSWGLIDSIAPACIQTHTWTTYDSNDKTNNAFLQYNLSGTLSGYVYGVNYDKRDYYDTTKTQTVEVASEKPSTTSPGGGKPGVVLSSVYQNERTFAHQGVSQYNHNIKFLFKFNRPQFYTLNWDKMTNDTLNKIINGKVYKYNGIPVTKVKKEGTITFKLTLNNPATGTYVYAISDKAFPNGDIPEHMYETVAGKQYDRIYKRGAVSRSGDEVIEVKFDKTKIFDTTNGDFIYIKCEPSVVGEIVTVSVDNVKETFTN